MGQIVRRACTRSTSSQADVTLTHFVIGQDQAMHKQPWRQTRTH